MSDKRRMGNSDLKVNAVGLGCMGFSHAYGAPMESGEAISMIRKAYDFGYDFFDTAECYIGTNANGSISFNEELVGKALKDIWMLCKKPYIIPIPGSRKEDRIKENIGSVKISLSEEDIVGIDRLLDGISVPVYGQKR